MAPPDVPKAAGVEAAAGSQRTVTLLAINDVYRIEGAGGGAEGGLARVRHLRAELEKSAPDLLLLHAGDMLFPSLPSRLYDGEQIIDVLNLLDGDAQALDERMFATFGNHEFDKEGVDDVPMLQSRIGESQFRWLASDIEWVVDDGGEPMIGGENLVRGAVVSSGGVRVGLFSLSTDFKHPHYVVRFGDPITVAREKTAWLRDEEGVDVVVALTHLRLDQDLKILRDLGDEGPDLIIGGHEHNRLAEQVGGRWVLKADAEARTATEVRLTVKPGSPPSVVHTFHELDATVPRDPDVERRVADWLGRFDREYCDSIDRSIGCLSEVVGQTRVELVGEELEIRRFETNYGNWMIDRAREAFAGEGAQIAFFNAGSLRLNQNVPAGKVLLEHVEETFQYPSELLLLKLTGSDLQAIVDHAVEDWSGAGHWLQVSGFAFRHDPATKSASDLTLLTPDGPRPIRPEEEILAVTNTYLATPGTGQDGYTMITEEMHVPVEAAVPELRQLVIDALGAAGEVGIAPEVEGRICNAERPGPCLVAGS